MTTDNSAANDGDFILTAEHKMLLAVRDNLYEGSWEDFIRDLRARADSKPYVFDSIPTVPEMKTTIPHHLKLIDAMQLWENERGVKLTAK